MSDQPKPTGEQEFGEQIFCWKCGRPYHTADRECTNCGGRNLTPDLCAKPTGEWTWLTVNAIEDACPDNERPSQAIADAHNATLAAAKSIGYRQGKLTGRAELAAGTERDEWFKALTTITKLEHQLAAERKKVQTYEGALIKIANDPNCDRCQVAVDALANVKEGK